MKASFIKTTEEEKTLAEVFGEEVLKNTLNKFREVGLKTNSFKESSINFKEELTKEELTTAVITILTNIDFVTQLALSLASTGINEGDKFEFNPIGDEDTNIEESLGGKNISIVLKKINDILNETNGNIGKTAEMIYGTMSTEEIIYGILFLL